MLASLLVPATRAAPLVLPALKIDDTSLKSPPVFALANAVGDTPGAVGDTPGAVDTPGSVDTLDF